MPVSPMIGSDPKAPPQMHGYSLNHFALIVKDMTAMRQFYGTILGIRQIFTYEVSPTYRVTYMGYPTNESGFQTGEELFRNLRHRDGLLEFLHPVPTADDNQDDRELRKDGRRAGRFSHLGVVVPDVNAAEQRMREFDVPILKGLGNGSIEPGSSVADWWGLDNMRLTEAKEEISAMGFDKTLIVEDPEGNVVEIMERE